MNVVVFGATGKIGRELIRYICRNDQSINITAVGYRKTFTFLDGMEYQSVDISKKENFSVLPEQTDAIINLAASVTTRVNSSDTDAYIAANIIGEANILQYALRAGADRIIYAQTYNDVFGHERSQIIINPDDARKRIYTGEAALYTITKNCAVDLQNYYQNQYGLKSFVLRLPTVYCVTRSPYYMVGGEQKIRPFRKMMMQASYSEPIEIWGNPDRVMDMVYVEDCCQLFFKALISNVNGGIYNVGTGIGTSIVDQVKGMIEVFSPKGRPSPIIYCPEKRSGPSYIMNIDGAREELGYEPKYTYLDMLKEFKRKLAELE